MPRQGKREPGGAWAILVWKHRQRWESGMHGITLVIFDSCKILSDQLPVEFQIIMNIGPSFGAQMVDPQDSVALRPDYGWDWIYPYPLDIEVFALWDQMSLEKSSARIWTSYQPNGDCHRYKREEEFGLLLFPEHLVHETRKLPRTKGLSNWHDSRKAYRTSGTPLHSTKQHHPRCWLELVLVVVS